jgi:hypothetical protein
VANSQLTNGASLVYETQLRYCLTIQLIYFRGIIWLIMLLNFFTEGNLSYVKLSLVIILVINVNGSLSLEAKQFPVTQGEKGKKNLDLTWDQTRMGNMTAMRS